MSILTYLRNKTAPYVLAAGLTASLLTGCSNKEIRTELSDVLYDAAVVTHKEHKPEDEQLATGVALGVAMNNLPVGVALGTAMSDDEKFYITLKGRKITFILNDKVMFNRFNINDAVQVTYQEMFRSTYQDIDGDGKEDLTGKTLTGYKFVDAQPTICLP